MLKPPWLISLGGAEVQRIDMGAEGDQYYRRIILAIMAGSRRSCYPIAFVRLLFI
jgi:hypothetical protein